MGTALGLLYSNLKKMNDLPDDMVDAWLNGMDSVLKMSGPPSWTERTGRTGRTGITENRENKENRENGEDRENRKNRENRENRENWEN